MAKKKAVAPTPAPAAETAESDRTVIVHLKGSPEYAAWLDGLNKKTHIPKAMLFRLAMAEYAKATGYTPPPER